MYPPFNTYKPFIHFSAWAIVLLGATIFIYGHFLKYKIIHPRIAGPVPMAIDAAFCFILLGISLLLSLKDTYSAIRMSRFFSMAILFIGSLELLQYFGNLQLPVVLGMSPVTASAFILSALGLLFIRDSIKPIYVQCAFHTITVVGTIVIIGHFLKVPEFYHLSFMPMSVYAAGAFLLSGVSASLIHPDSGLTSIFTGKRIGNLMARRLSLIC